MMKKNGKNCIALALLLCLTLLTAYFSLNCGQISMGLDNVLGVLCSRLNLPFLQDISFTREQEAVIWYIRLPRTIIALLVGAALGVSGAVMQGIFSNPLADPGLIGVSSGAAAGAVFCLALNLHALSMFWLPACAFAGSVLAVFLTVFLALRNGKIPVVTLLLAGVAVGLFLGAVTSGVLTFVSEQKLQEYLFWSVGGLDYRRWEHVQLAVVPILTGLVIMLLLARHLNILALGETEARAVGMNVSVYRMGLLLVAAMTTATAVCVSGNIGFVGLVMPHMMRLLLGPDHRVLLPASALGGAFFLVFCDALGRVLIAPQEIKVGVMTALLGTPYFLFLLRKLQKHDS